MWKNPTIGPKISLPYNPTQNIHQILIKKTTFSLPIETDKQIGLTSVDQTNFWMPEELW
jgi:hypothetical protein